MTQAFRLTIDNKGIARLIFDLPGEKINKMSLQVLNELDVHLEDLKLNKQIKALVFTSAKEGIFIAGADLKGFENLFDNTDLAKEMIKQGHAVFNKIENLPFPTIAAINGACLGGGLELALACKYRIVGDHKKTLLGLPETTLGIFPGWGGTQRLPRLVGLTEGLTMILSGQPVNAQKAYKIHLADAIYISEFLEEHIDKFAELILTEKGRKSVLEKRKRTGIYPLLFENNPFGRAIVYWKSKKSVLEKTKGQYPSPLAALEVVKKTYTLPLKKGLQKELDAFINGMSGDFQYAPNLIYIYFNSEAMKKDPGLHYDGVKGKPIKNAGVLGAGVMGSGIAWLLSYKDISVRLKDINWEAVGKGIKAIWDSYLVLVKKRKLTKDQMGRKFHFVSGTVDYSGFKQADIVIEAATENLELKLKILKELEQNINPETIIATNTSSLTLDQLTPALKRPEKFVGLHFFNPPARMPLVEIVAGKHTSPETIQTAFELCTRLNKVPVVVGDCSGFLVNRVFAHGFVEIMRMYEEGVPRERLDKVLLKFGLPMAPFELADEIGNDVNVKAMKSFEKAYGPRMKVPPILEKVAEKGWYGKKTGKGFNIYDGKSVKPNSEIDAMVPKREASSISDEEIVDRVMLLMINESARCLEENIVANPGYLDMALVFGVGFPPFRGGLLRYADSIGIDRLMEKFNRFEKQYGERFAPCALLVEMQQDKQGFFSRKKKKQDKKTLVHV